MISKLSGDTGEVWIGKSTRAGSLLSWIAVPSTTPGAMDFSGRLGDRDAFLMSQGPDTVRLPLGNTGRQWRWTGSLEIEGDAVRATFVGPPEER